MLLSSKLTESFQEACLGILPTPFERHLLPLGDADTFDVGQGGRWYPDGALRAGVPG